MKSLNLQQTLDKINLHYVEGNEFDAILTPYEINLIKDYFSGKKFLEMGCSIGNSTIQLLKFTKSIDIVEGSGKNITSAKRKVAQIAKNDLAKLTFYKMLWEEFPFDKDYSDVFWIRGIEHVKNPQKILKKILISLKKTKGRLHLVTVNAFSLNRRIGVLMGMLKDVHELSDRDLKFGHFKVYDKKQLEIMLKKCGYKILQSTGIMLKPLPNNKMYELYKENPKIIHAFNAIGKELPDYCTEVYICAAPN
ncbi:MAG: hypothetical protein ACD_31C00036G0001 [uncultured bacterium]|nr:MAG: hypothetical protein ACD_31C00036G0001 [uncultured bacterium]